MSQKSTMKQAQTPALIFPLALVFFEIVTYFSNDMYLPSLPALTRDLGISHDIGQYTLSLWFLGSASMQLFMGPLSDRYGRRPILLWGGLCFVIASFVCALTSDITLMLTSRFIQGCTVCSVVVAGYSAIHESYDDETAIKIIALMSSITVLAPALGPFLGAIILEFFSWRGIFHCLGIGGLIGMLWLARVMPETREKAIKIEVVSILKDYIAIGTRQQFLAFTLPFCCLFLALIAWIVESPFIVIETYACSPMVYGAIQMIVFGSFSVGAQTTRLLLPRLTAIKIIHYGILLGSFAAMMLFIGIALNHTSLQYVVACMALIAFGTAMAFGPLNRLAIETCEEPMGRRVAVFSSYMSLFGLIGTVMVTLTNDKTIENLALLIAFGMIAAFIAFNRLYREPPPTQTA